MLGIRQSLFATSVYCAGAALRLGEALLGSPLYIFEAI